jgi:hypothetical protein
MSRRGIGGMGRVNWHGRRKEMGEAAKMDVRNSRSIAPEFYGAWLIRQFCLTQTGQRGAEAGHGGVQLLHAGGADAGAGPAFQVGLVGTEGGEGD